MTLKGLIAAEKISTDQLFLRKSASVFRSDRPSSFNEIIPLIEKWGGK